MQVTKWTLIDVVLTSCYISCCRKLYCCWVNGTWDLDIVDEVQASATLGGVAEKKKKGKKKYIKYKDGSHIDSVLGLAWNKEFRNTLASASADKLVKIWDVATETFNLTLENHTDKV
ncbi:uncharacterized protein LOC130988946 isoform X1 [Salvia miltiorrhiza]|uniref:uncharacterized protein LOC130988946 isoform X1 n=1 Tax=Salvia miltiorrhiza TaxID=226208 RepID=UPI0025ACF160|nr:uncharacterized protein LOC130988946 isoform X1 [Salvia miltiorrhiza]XP_057768921.1 uncharacterized protein LOC130988946 isoform X1 [Salvia miltiorrhiza]